MISGLAHTGLARERADETPHGVAAPRAEWKPLAALDEIRGDWHALAARALEPNVFYDPAFALPAADVFGNPGAVLVWSKAGTLIGLFPARSERRYGVLATLTGWTHPYAPFGLPLIDRDEVDAATMAFLDHVEADADLPKLVMLPLVSADGAFAASLACALLRRGGAMETFGAHQRALLAPSGDRIRYVDHIPHKKLKELRRQRRRLSERGEVTLETAHDPHAVASAFADFITLEADGWKGRAGSAALEHPAISSFMRKAVMGLAAEGRARIDRLTQHGRTIAATITLQSGDTAWLWKIAYEETVARASPGVQLTLDVTEKLVADPAVARVDSCATAHHPMIDHIWSERLALADLLIAPSAASLSQFRVARHLETLRRILITTAKTVRDRKSY